MNAIVKTMTSQKYTDSEGFEKITPWFQDTVDLVDYLAERGGTITGTFVREGGDMYEMVAGERVKI